jgi:hypothetical protein
VSENLKADELSGSYHAMQVQVRHNVGKLNVEGNYTWSHAINDMNLYHPVVVTQSLLSK